MKNKDLNKKEDIRLYMKRRELVVVFWVSFFIVSLISLISIPLKQTLSFVLFLIIALIMVVFSKKIINLIWSGIR